MSSLQAAELPRKVAQKYGIRGLDIVSTFSPEVVGVVVLDDLTNPLETDLSFERLCIGNEAIGASAGNIHLIQLNNPSQSDITVHAEAALVSSSTAQLIDLRRHTAELTNLVTAAQKSFRDLRITGDPAAEVRDVTQAAGLGDQIEQFYVSASETLVIPLDFALEPAGDKIHFQSNTANTELRVTWYWTERGQLRG